MQRLRLIDCILDQFGTFNRGIISDYFGVSTAQASLDMRAYLEMAPKNAAYDLRAKTYRRTDSFTRVFP